MHTLDLPYADIAELFDRNPDVVEEAGQQWLAGRQKRNRPLVPDIRLLASLSDFSIASVSNFMRGKQGSVSEANAQRLAQLVDMVGYVPSSAAQSLRGRQTYMIGVAVPLSSISPDFYLQILSGIKREAEILGYGSMIFDVTTEEARDDFFAKMPFLGIVDGLIVIGLHIDERRLRILDQQQVPVAVVHNRLEQPPVVANVLPASERALRNLIDQHLIRQHGYRRLALVTLSCSNPLKMGEADRPDWTRAARIQAYQEALRSNEIPIDENIIFEVADHSFAEGYRVFQELERMNEGMDAEDHIEAVVCTSDTLAAAVFTAVRRNGLEVAVTGFDNLPLAELLDITTVEQRAGEVGRLAFRHLYNALVYNHRTGSFPAFEKEDVDMHVVIRCSCGCPHGPSGR